MSTSVGIRQTVEKAIAAQFVKDALAVGKRLAVSLERGYDTDEMLLGSTEEKKILEEMFAGDECHVFIQAADGPTVDEGVVVSEGWVYFVMGNDGWDVISDNLSNTLTNEILKGAERLASQIEAGEFDIVGWAHV